MQALPLEASDPYYRPPRRRQDTITADSPRPSTQRASLPIDPNNLSATPATGGDAAEAGAEISRGATPAPPAASGVNPVNILPNRPDYSTREVDFYYGVRGPALNSDAPGRKLGTGPADPTGPVATAAGWFRTMFGNKTKEKGKGFEVVRSARMPPHMARNGGFGDETPPEGIPVAMGVLRNGPIDSDDEDEPGPKRTQKRKPGDLLTDDGAPRGPEDDEPESPIAERLPRGSLPPGPHEPIEEQDKLELPRKSSKRHSASGGSSGSATPAGNEREREQGQATPQITRLPFERTGSQKRLSSHSSTEFSLELSRTSSNRPELRPTSFGMVSQHSISRVDPEHREADLLGTTAELVDERSNASR